MDNVEGRVIMTIADTLQILEDDISVDSNLERDLCADSLDVVNIVYDLEREFDITIPDEELWEADYLKGDCTVQDVINIINDKIWK